uniref:G-protein coupled receptors family 3 profile domain-containing protein n=1 Tax=Strigamia maritima TaxID=126957 RepID=T1IIA3_STRMM
MGFGWVWVIPVLASSFISINCQDPKESEDIASNILNLIQSVREEANCTRTSLAHYNYDFPPALRTLFNRTAALCVNAANVLNSVHQPEVVDSAHEESLLYSLVNGLVVGDELIFAAAVVVRRDKLRIPFAYRTGINSGSVKWVDAASVWRPVEEEWGPGAQWLMLDSAPDVDVRDVSDGGVVWSAVKDEWWTAPFFDCGLTNKWLAALSVPFYGRDVDKKVVIRGVVAIMFDMDIVDVNQCAGDESLLADTHRCDRLTMQCHPMRRQGLRPGAYSCSCRAGYFFPEPSNPHGRLNGSQVDAITERSELRCAPCRSGCASCVDESPCFVEYDVLLRGFPLGVQSFSMTIAIIIAVIVFRLRKAVTIATGMWTMLEMILIGAILIYATVVCRYFEPTTLNCLLEPWFRELGFAFCYGAIVLKMYKILVEFRTRKAHRWVVRDKDLLKYLAAIVLVVSGYMAAWTALNIHLLQEGYTVLAVGFTPDGLRYIICRSAWWEYVTETGELLFLLFGVHLSYHARNAVTEFGEKRYLCLAIFIELLVSVALHVLRHVLWLDVNPDYIFLMYFIRCQITVTVILILVFGPKLWYYHRPPREDPEHRGEHTVHETVKLQDGVTSNGEVDIGEINLADMDPEDIRAELRRVYTQLQILRNKTMRKDNPHISKRRGGRKATHRRFSLQAFHPRHRPYNGGGDHEAEHSKTPEESTASGDIPPDPDAIAVTSPSNVTFKGLMLK